MREIHLQMSRSFPDHAPIIESILESSAMQWSFHRMICAGNIHGSSSKKKSNVCDESLKT